MNLYLSLGHIWTGTQADARAAQGGKDFQSIDVPTDKAGLLAFLNGLEGGREPSPDFEQGDDGFIVEAALSPSLAAVGPYRNGDPTLITNGSRDPGARA